MGALLSAARTEKVGDDRNFGLPLKQTIRIRTEDKDEHVI